MIERIIIAGSGGQGIMLMGKILAEAAMLDNLHVTWFPTYGAEVRGGAAYCMVIISSEDIPSPYIEKADTLIAMNEASLLKFRHRLRSRGLLLMNSSLISKSIKTNASLKVYAFPFTEAASRLGNIRVANMVALGIYIAKRGIFNKQIILSIIERIAPAQKRDLIEVNRQALEEGMRLVR